MKNKESKNSIKTEKEYPKYSVLMSIYKKDNVEWLKYAIDCMLNQTVKPAEFVIVEDGPLTKELNKAIDAYLKVNSIFNVVKIEKNGGLGPALKLGVEKCNNEWIARMDADDYSPEDRIEKQFNVLKKYPDIGIIGSNAVEFYENIENSVSNVNLPEMPESLYKFAKRRCPFRHSGILYRKSEILRAGNYQECYLFEDYDLYARMFMQGTKGYNVQEDLLYVRVSPDFYKRRGGIKYLKSILKTKKRFYKMGFYSFKDYFISSFAHIVVCLMPNKLRDFIYRKFLRK